ncbi:hypothetical protein PAPYR_8733 [Paratrimastix pyriformis]|uniref:Uncharacterized protein n=1 Tax=Paratrimastix pyriformis TaxID=342808 RepID=A0ABQ8U9Z7_9EUKA|nr:hypothetical protein PAPYR_8733 [Paratrimastix pyriformis]
MSISLGHFPLPRVALRPSILGHNLGDLVLIPVCVLLFLIFTTECGTFLEYIDPPPIAALWKCPVCEQHLEDPVVLQCGHNVCRRCVPSDHLCPTPGCGKHFDAPIPNPSAEWTVRGIKAHLAGECPAQRARCPQCGRAVARAERAAHLAERCPGRRVACPKCTQLVAARELMQSETGARHLRQECPRRLRACRKGCGQRVPLADMEEHCRRDCPNKPPHETTQPFSSIPPAHAPPSLRPRLHSTITTHHHANPPRAASVPVRWGGLRGAGGPARAGCPRAAHLGAHVDLLLGALTRAQAEAAQTRHELALTKDQLAQTRQQAARTEQLLEQTRQQARDAERLLDQTGQQTFQNERLLDQTRHELGQAKAQAAQHGRQLAQTKEALDQTRQQAARTEQTLEQTRQALDQTRQELAQSRQAMAGLTGRLEALAATVAPLEEARRKAAEEASRKAAEEQEARRKAEEARRKAAEEEARRKAAAEEEARCKAEEEARRKAAEEQEARRKAEEEARRKAAAEVEALRKAAAEAEADPQVAAVLAQARGCTDSGSYVSRPQVAADRCAVALADWLATNRTVTVLLIHFRINQPRSCLIAMMSMPLPAAPRLPPSCSSALPSRRPSWHAPLFLAHRPLLLHLTKHFSRLECRVGRVGRPKKYGMLEIIMECWTN